jgi:biopolymer transport protein ExbB
MTMMKQPEAWKTRAGAVLFAALFLATVVPPILCAQEAQPAPKAAPAAPATPAKSAPAEPAPEVEEMTFWGLIQAGGWSMIPLGICSVALVGLAIYNAVVIQPGRLLQPAVATRINDALSNLDVEGAKTLCRSNPSLVSNVAAGGLDRIKDGHLEMTAVEKGMEEASSGEVAIYLVPINYLSVVAVISPMLGLLGTVSGMIKAFKTMSVAGMGRPEMLSANISEALITTAAGLIIGIPAMVAYFFFKYRYMGIVSSLSRICGGMMQTMRDAVRRVETGMMIPPAPEMPEGAPEA